MLEDFSTNELAQMLLLGVALGYLFHVIYILVKSVKPDD